MDYSREEKLKIVEGLNWDYDVVPEDLLAVIEGRQDEAGPFDRKRLFVRCLERMPWHRIAGLWGIEESEKLLGPETIQRVRSRARRAQLERLEKILRGEPVPPPEWNAELRKKLGDSVFSHRWYRAQPRLF